MRDFLIIWAFLVLNYYLGYQHRGWVDARKRERAKAEMEAAFMGVCEGCGEPRPCTHFKAWLTDFIAINTPRREDGTPPQA